MSVMTDEEIANGWRVVSVSSNALSAATFTMQTDAFVWESAQRCGRGWGSWKIPVGCWHFPFGDNGWTNAFVWAEGYFRSRFNEDEIQPTFELPIVRPRVIPVRAFVASPPRDDRRERWRQSDVGSRIEVANDIFSQVGIQFDLLSVDYDFCSNKMTG